METTEKQPEQLNERAAAVRRLLASYQANLDAVASHASQQQISIRRELDMVQTKLQEMEKRGYMDDNARKEYRELSKKASELDTLDGVAGEVFDRADMVIPL